MSEQTIKQTIEAYLSDNWASTPIAWENTEPRNHSLAGAPLLYEGSLPYIYVQVQVTDTKAVSVPLHCVRYFGDIMVDIHVPEGTGSRQAAAYLDLLRNLLQYKTLAHNIRTKEYVRVGNEYLLRAGWVTYSAQWPFEAEFN